MRQTFERGDARRIATSSVLPSRNLKMGSMTTRPEHGTLHRDG
jgi:hypothetical protein